jgi:hypothetical protein
MIQHGSGALDAVMGSGAMKQPGLFNVVDEDLSRKQMAFQMGIF